MEDNKDDAELDLSRYGDLVTWRGRKDVLLALLVNSVNKSEGSRISMTFTMNGAMVSGNVVPNKEWMLLNAARLESISPGVAGFFHGFAEMIEEDTESEILDIEYIHLVDARLNIGGTWLGADGDLWRGRIGDVTGWTIGMYS